MKYRNNSKMKRLLSLIVGLLIAFCLPADLQAQTSENLISVSFKEKDLYAILDYISGHSDYAVDYSNEVKNYTDKMTVSFDEVGAVKAVQELLSKTPFTYDVEGKVIKVFRLERAQTGNYTIRGVVTDGGGKPIPGATVTIKGLEKGTLTDLNGKFAMKSATPAGELIASAMGFDGKPARYTSGTDVRIVLHDRIQALGEVTVIAYGKKNKRELVGAISSVKGQDLQDLPASSLETLLQGKMAGVDVSNLSGQPGGGGSQVVIRGFSSLNQQGINDGSPLYVIDGVPVQSSASENTGGINPLSSLDPSTIESVEVLKDAASASLYGSRAGNGVILITTKKGKSGRAEFNVSVSQSLSWLPATPLQLRGHGERQFQLLLAKMQRIGHYDWESDKVIVPNDYNSTWGWDAGDGAYDYLWNNGKIPDEYSKVPLIMQDSLNTFYNNNTNWWKYVFRVGQVTRGDLQASGGNDNVRYMVSAGIYNEKGIMINSDFMRANFLSNLDFKLTPWLDAFTRVNLSYTDQKAGSMNKVQGLTIDPKTESTLLPGKGTIAEEKAMESLQGIKGTNTNYNIRLNAGLNWKIWKGLKFSTTASIDHYMTHINTFYPDYLTSNGKSKSEGQNIGMTSLQWENLLTYDFNLKEKHNFNLMAGMSYNRDQLQSIGGSAQGGPTNQIHYVGEGWPLLYLNEYGTYEALQRYQSNNEVQAMLSYFGRVSYNYDKKYLLDLSIRTDGSSVFGSNVRWGTFPSVGLGWAFSEEPFMKDLWWLSFGKLRASWGKSGQKFQEAYLALGIMSESNSFLGSAGLIPAILANNNLTWEKSDQYDVGLDLQLFNYRVQMTLDYYYKYSSALLMQTSVPGSYFLADKMWNNASAISNEGIEFEFSADILKGGPFEWTFGFNISHNRNMFRKSYGGVDLPDKILGRPIYGIYTYHDEGIVQDASQIPYYYNELGKRVPLSFNNENYPLRVGGRKIKDQNMDGIINTSDRYYAGSTLPAAYGGISNRFSWKGFTLDVMMNYVISRKMMNMVKGSAFSFNKSFGVIMADPSKVTFWKKPGDDADFPSLEFADDGYIGQFDGDIDSNIEDVSFLRLKQATLSYKFPLKWFKNKIKEFRVYVTGKNLFLLTNYSGLDPETVNPYTGKDLGDQYPLNREVTLGFNLKF